MPADLLQLNRNPSGDRLTFRPHPGQQRAWDSPARFVCVLAGTQSGKTSFGPIWLYREIQRCGPGDYMVITPTFQLLEKKALPEFKKLFEQWMRLGAYQTSPSRKFTFSREGQIRTFGNATEETQTTVWFGYAEDPDSLESATAKAAWCDEAGQRRFRLGSWEALQRRLAIHQGRALITTTPYDLGWLKQQVWDRWRAGDPDYQVVRFDSTENPVFPQAEFERARRDLPRWKFDLFYRGIFTRPAGLIYDSFSDEHKIPRFDLPRHWRRYCGVDFGNNNTAAVFFAAEPDTQRLFLYRTYRAGGRSSKDHAAALLKDEPMTPIAVGGSHQEEGWRDAFRSGGLPISEPPVNDVEVQIDCVYGAHSRGEILVFNDLDAYLDEKASYARELDENGEPTEKIADKSSYHLMDAERYVISKLRPHQVPGTYAAGGQRTMGQGYVVR